MSRPVLFVLAGVNGAGKSSIGGSFLSANGLTWFNPDTFAREWKRISGCTQEEANAAAWHEGVRRLQAALDRGASHAFETTLGGRTIPRILRAAAETHDVHMWFCGLASVELHIARVRVRVVHGGHDIPEQRIRERFTAARRSVIELMPHLALLRVYDNSTGAPPGTAIPDPELVMEMEAGTLAWPPPSDAAALAAVPTWAKPLAEAALRLHDRRRARG